MSGHTPGPWFVHPKWRRVCAHDDTSFSVVESNRLADSLPPHDEDLANLNLIAAAPEMLKALRDVMGWVPGPAHWHTDEPMQALERARATIAKATQP